MSGAMRKIGEYLGLLEDTGVYDDEYDEYAEPEAAAPAQRTPAKAQPAPVADLSQRRRTPAAAPVAVAELSRITTLHPRTYNEAKTIGEAFRSGIPVIMNLGDMADADAKRLVDFAAGLVFGLHGAIEKVTSKVFLLSPAHVEVTPAGKPNVPERAFFNQS